MNFQEARKKSLIYRLVGALIVIPSVISTIISFLKMIYFRLDDGTEFGSILTQPFKKMVEIIHQHTDFLIIFWNKSPVPNHMNISEPQNIPFILIYLTIFFGITFWGAGSSLSLRLRKIRKKIEDQVIEESIKGVAARTHAEIRKSIVIPSNGMFSEAHKLYLAPIVVTVIGAVLVKFLDL
ncbi:putative yfeABCD locus regulator [Shewanella denitrificans OS217]|uniref:Putative yfeABCD locus regulator n=1 Tax=Shewanella denitrificans (strain OS217 / ATCC BAA-1090 / DSM 15013) TaxID=318161 RepID=Q12J19_SHEDO|nr:YniB family protein [Shewanella denitrificans]ABE56557.1 putative yfeABCD locus regulator [Shewanella denitrificans OS217]